MKSYIKLFAAYIIVILLVVFFCRCGTGREYQIQETVVYLKKIDYKEYYAIKKTIFTWVDERGTTFTEYINGEAYLALGTRKTVFTRR